MRRAEAIALLKEITSDGAVVPNWVSLVNTESGKCELHIDSQTVNPASLKPIVEKHDLETKETGGLLVFYRKPRS
jgi:hypothetical protein